MFNSAGSSASKRGANDSDKDVGIAALGKSGRTPDTPVREAKRKRVVPEEQFEDIPMETVSQIIATIDDPNYMTRPDVSFFLNNHIQMSTCYQLS